MIQATSPLVFRTPAASGFIGSTAATRVLEALYSRVPLVLDERLLLRDALGPLLARSAEVDFAVARLRLGAVDLRADELAALRRCRLLVERMEGVTGGEALGASRATMRSRLELLLAFLESGRVEVRVGAGRCWAPDFSVFHEVRLAGGVVLPQAAALGAHFFSRPYPVAGPAVTCLIAEPDAAALLAARFDELWAVGYDVAFVVWERLRRLLGKEEGPGTPLQLRERPPARAATPASVARTALELRFGRERPAPARAAPRIFDLAAFQKDAVERAERALSRHGGVVLADGVGLGKTFLGLALAEAELRRGGHVLVTGPAALRKEWLVPLRRLARECHASLAAVGRAVRSEAEAPLPPGGEPPQSAPGQAPRPDPGERQSAPGQAPCPDLGEPPQSAPGQAPRPDPGERPRPMVTWLTHARLSRTRATPDLPAGACPPAPTLVVVDEAHAFRNPATRRYRALAGLCRGARVALLTATPVNNALWDLYFQLRLFAGDGAFARAGVPDLREAFAAAAEAAGPGPILPVLREVVIRRTRPFLRDHYGAVALPGAAAPIAFPRRAPPTPVRYTLASAFPGGLAAVAESLGSLRLVPYRLGEYGAGSHGSDAAAELLRFSLLKRLESSPAAFRRSLIALLELEESFARALAEGRLLRPRERALVAAEQLLLGAVALDALPRGMDRDRLAADVAADVDVLRRLAQSAAGDGVDPKLERLRALLAELGEKVVVFTEFRDSALAIARGLGGLRCGLIHGGGAWMGGTPIGRRELIERFAPAANGARVPPERERVDVLVATDVLAEGLNLQDARCVVSYDLPWNPVRLMQRIGRVDRLGSPHAEIAPFHFVPESGLEELLGLLRRIRGKLGVIRRTIPGDVDVLHCAAEVGAATETALARILGGEAGALEALERAEAAPLEAEDRLRRLWAALPAGAVSVSRDPAEPVVTGVLLPDLPTDRVLLCFDGPAPAWIAWDRAGGPREDDVAAAAILGAALDSARPTEPPAELLRAAQEEARALLRGRAGGARPRPNDAVALVSRRLLRALAAARHRPDPTACARADLLLERLARGVDAGTEAALRRVLAGPPPDSAAALVARIEAALGPDSPAADPPDQAVPDPWGVSWRLRAAIVARPPGAVVGPTSDAAGGCAPPAASGDSRSPAQADGAASPTARSVPPCA